MTPLQRMKEMAANECKALRQSDNYSKRKKKFSFKHLRIYVLKVERSQSYGDISTRYNMNRSSVVKIVREVSDTISDFDFQH